MKKNFLSLTVSVAMAGTVLAGCSSGSKDSAGKVYWLNFKPEADEALQQIAKDYKEETGVEVKVVTAASGKYQETLTAEMDKSEAPTLFVVGNQAAVKTWGDYCYDLKDTDVYKELTTDDFTLYNGEEVASIGYCYETFGIIVNKTLLAKAGYSVEDITNFNTLKSVADDIHARAGELGFDAFTSSGMDDSSSWRFTGHLANLPLYYESVDDNWTECPAEVKGTYLDNFKNIWDLYITDSAVDKTTLATGGYDAEAEFKDGKAVFYQNGSWEYAELAKTYSDDELAMIPIYFGVDDENEGLATGTENYWCVNKNASEEDVQATLDFMNWCVTSEAGTKSMSEDMGFTIPFKTAVAPTNVFVKQDAEYTEAGLTPVSWNFTTMPSEEWKNGLGTALTAYAAGTGDWDAVVSAFVDGWATEKALSE